MGYKVRFAYVEGMFLTYFLLYSVLPFFICLTKWLSPDVEHLNGVVVGSRTMPW